MWYVVWVGLRAFSMENKMTINTYDTETFREMISNAVELADAFSKMGAALQEELAKLTDFAKDHKSIDLSALGVAMYWSKNTYEDIDEKSKKLYHFSDMLNKFLLPERMKEQNTDGFRVPEIARSFSIVEKTSASFVDKEKGLEWLREIGQGDMVQETVNAGTLASFCRNMLLEQGLEPPADVVKVSTYSTTSMTKYRPKKGEL